VYLCARVRVPVRACVRARVVGWSLCSLWLYPQHEEAHAVLELYVWLAQAVSPRPPPTKCCPRPRR
jgi:hypothetical protein